MYLRELNSAIYRNAGGINVRIEFNSSVCFMKQYPCNTVYIWLSSKT